MEGFSVFCIVICIYHIDGVFFPLYRQQCQPKRPFGIGRGGLPLCLLTGH